ncbi:MAG: pyrroline-5-carboxylate reductase family protein, partial [Bradymonadaceae bacterium]
MTTEDTPIVPIFDSRLEAYLVVLVGCGKMGSALAYGWVDSGALDPRRLVCIDHDEKKAQALADDLNAREAVPEVELDDEGQPVRRPRLYVIAVKPEDVKGVLEHMGEELTEEDTVISVAAGLSIAQLRRWAGPEVGIVRTMPNTPVSVRAGVTGVMGD